MANQGMKKRAGITRITGGFRTVLKILEVAENGISKKALIGKIVEWFPTVSPSSAATYVGVVKTQLDLLDKNSGLLFPNEIGVKILRSNDPTFLIPRFMMGVIGFDVILIALRKHSSLPKKMIVSLLQNNYSNWTTDYMPNHLMYWSETVGLIEQKPNSEYVLTPLGENWADWVENNEDAVIEQVAITTQEQSPIESVEDFEQEDEKDWPLPSSVKSSAIKEDVPQEKPFSFTWRKASLQKTSLQDIEQYLTDLPYHFDTDLLREFYVALHTHEHKRFVLLSGLSGTGKSLLVREFANAYHGIVTGSTNPYYHLAAVQPDWMDASPLLGYVNPLTEKPIYMQTPVLTFLFSALENPEKAHFLCLDEMNLARSEYYFAPFLTAMESRDELKLHQSDESLVRMPATIPWPENLFIIGTVNMDETTHSFSDKLLDRAFTFELWNVDLNGYRKRLKDKGSTTWKNVDGELLDQVIESLDQVMKPLVSIRQHFGYRTVEEILRFVVAFQRETGDEDILKPLDRAIYMKVLPKLRGEDRPEILQAFEELETVMVSRKFGTSLEKVQQMKLQLRNGTTRFWGA